MLGVTVDLENKKSITDVLDILASKIDITFKNNTTIITFKEDVVIQGKGNLIIHNPDGITILKSQSLHLNPKYQDEVDPTNSKEFVEKTLESIEYNTNNEQHLHQCSCNTPRDKKINKLLGIRDEYN